MGLHGDDLGQRVKWPDALVDALTPQELSAANPAAVRAWIDAVGKPA